MSEYDSQKWNLFRLPLLWFLVAAIFAQLIIALNSPDSVAAPPAPRAMSVPLYMPFHESPPAPVKVELPVPQKAVQQIVTKSSTKLLKKVAPPPSVSIASGTIETVIQFAMNQRGKPYVWGAAGPNSYDCSGLVLAAFSKIGLKLPHFTGALIGHGTAVARGALQRGDIVFPQRGHVAIYLGDGMMIHAPQPGDVVKISKVYAFYAARRLV